VNDGRYAFVRRRLLQLPFLVFGITVITFLLLRLIPGNPALVILGNHYTAAGARQVNQALGLDKPLPAQYWQFVSRLGHGNLGYSFFYNASARSVIDGHIGPTLFVIVYAAVLAALVAIPLGVIAGMHQNGLIDHTSRAFFTVGFAIPSFWLGLILVLLFSVHIQAFPIDGYGNGFIGHLYYLFLPALTLAIPFSTVLIRSLRSSVITVSRADYVDTARIKGIKSRQVLSGHIVRNAIVTVVSVFGVNLAYLVGGTVLIENVFSLPGLGSLLVSSVSTRDYPVVQGITLIFALAIVVVNLLTDVVHAMLDPRAAVGSGE
jgi:ABC-type dipeptide/oligopeptide/nickel transport system permease component